MLKGLAQKDVKYPLDELFNKAALKGQTAVIIGRGEATTLNITTGCDVPEEAALVLSRQHARLEVRGGQLCISDNRTVNHTYLNNQQLPPEEWSVVNDGDVISFGGPKRYKHNDKDLKNPWSYKVKSLANFLSTYVAAHPEQQPAGTSAAEPTRPKKYIVRLKPEAASFLARLEQAALRETGSHRQSLPPASEPAVAETAAVASEAAPSSKPRPQSAPASQRHRPSAREVIDLTGDSDDEAQLTANVLGLNHSGLASPYRHAGQKREHAPGVKSEPSGVSKRGKPTMQDSAGGRSDQAPSLPKSENPVAAAPNASIEGVAKEFMCAICQETIVVCYSMYPCGHNFCAECLAGWVKNKKDCPTCRTKASVAPIRQNAIDNAIAAIEAQLPEDEREVRKEKRDSWEANRENLEKAIKAPWDKNSQREPGRHASLAAALQYRLGMHGGPPPSAMELYGPLMVGGPPPRAHPATGVRIVERHSYAREALRDAFYAGNLMSRTAIEPRSSRGQRREGASHPSSATARPQRVPSPANTTHLKEYCARYASPTAAHVCPRCNVAASPGELRIGMRPLPSQLALRREENNPYEWFHLDCFPAERWPDVGMKGCKDLRNLSPSDQSRIRERIRGGR